MIRLQSSGILGVGRLGKHTWAIKRWKAILEIARKLLRPTPNTLTVSHTGMVPCISPVSIFFPGYTVTFMYLSEPNMSLSIHLHTCTSEIEYYVLQ